MKVDIKRLFLGKTALFFALAVPVVLALLISLMVAPYFYADVRTQGFSVAVLNEDDHVLTRTLLQGLAESKSLSGLIQTEYVDSREQGLEAVEKGAAAFIHIPIGLQRTLETGGRMDISYYGNQRMPLEDKLLFESLSSGISLVSHAQHAVNAFFFAACAQGTGFEEAASSYNRLAGVFFVNVLMRDALYEAAEETSPLGGALPVEYYAASLLVLFVSLGSLPIARITASDGGGGLLHRQLLSGRTPLGCFVSRWIAGSIFLFVQYTVLALALFLVAGTGGGNVLLLLAAGLLLCAFLSLCGMCAGLFSKTAASALTTVFIGTLALGLLGGLLLPSAYMPSIVRDISYYTPFAAGLKLSIAGMFDKNAGGLIVFFAMIGICTAALLFAGYWRFQRRLR